MVRKIMFSFNLVWAFCRASQMQYNYYVQNMATNGIVTNFGYDPESSNSPANWKEFAPACGGSSQSPINIQKKQAVKIKGKMGVIKGTKWIDMPTVITVDNNGHTVRFLFGFADESNPTILLNGDVYEFTQLHYHFGLDRKSGSEHLINNRGYAMEGHAVFYNLNYKTLTNALKHEDGLAVIGRFYDETDRPNVIDINFEFLRHVINPNNTYYIDDPMLVFSLENIMGPLNLPYYMYRGSLTTPGCNEVVTWCVGAKLLPITSHNVFQFRQLVGHEGLMAPNIRPIQKLNDRIVYYYKHTNKLKSKKYVRVS